MCLSGVHACSARPPPTSTHMCLLPSCATDILQHQGHQHPAALARLLEPQVPVRLLCAQAVPAARRADQRAGAAAHASPAPRTVCMLASVRLDSLWPSMSAGARCLHHPRSALTWQWRASRRPCCRSRSQRRQPARRLKPRCVRRAQGCSAPAFGSDGVRAGRTAHAPRGCLRCAPVGQPHHRRHLPALCTHRWASCTTCCPPPASPASLRRPSPLPPAPCPSLRARQWRSTSSRCAEGQWRGCGWYGYGVVWLWVWVAGHARASDHVVPALEEEGACWP